MDLAFSATSLHLIHFYCKSLQTDRGKGYTYRCAARGVVGERPLGVLFKLYWAKFYAVGDAKQGDPKDAAASSLWLRMPYKSFYKVAAAAVASLNSIYEPQGRGTGQNAERFLEDWRRRAVRKGQGEQTGILMKLLYILGAGFCWAAWLLPGAAGAAA